LGARLSAAVIFRGVYRRNARLGVTCSGAATATAPPRRNLFAGLLQQRSARLSAALLVVSMLFVTVGLMASAALRIPAASPPPGAFAAFASCIARLLLRPVRTARRAAGATARHRSLLHGGRFEATFRALWDVEFRVEVRR